MQENRDLSFDAFRGLAIIAVVAIHAAYLGGSVGFNQCPVAMTLAILFDRDRTNKHDLIV